MNRLFPVKLSDHKGSHFYQLGDNDTYVPGVTTVIGSTFHKPFIGPWMVKQAGLYIEDFLKTVATRRTIKKKNIDRLIRRAKRQWRYTRDKAAAFGSAHHTMFESPYDITHPEEEDQCTQNFMEWYAKTDLKIVGSEVQAGSIKYQYGCTIDAICQNSSGKIEIAEYKTATSIHDDYAYQVAAQSQALKETFGLAYLPEGRVVRFDKEKRLIEERGIQDIKKTFDVYINLLQVYNDKKINKWRISE